MGTEGDKTGGAGMIPVTLVTPDRIDTLPVSLKALTAVENIARSSGTADAGYEVAWTEHGRQITIQNISAAAMQQIHKLYCGGHLV